MEIILSRDVELTLTRECQITNRGGVNITVGPDVRTVIPRRVVDGFFPLLIDDLTPRRVVSGEVSTVEVGSASESETEGDETSGHDFSEEVVRGLDTRAEEAVGDLHGAGGIDGILVLLRVLEVGHGFGGVEDFFTLVEEPAEGELRGAGGTGLELVDGHGGGPSTEGARVALSGNREHLLFVCLFFRYSFFCLFFVKRNRRTLVK